MTLAERRMLMLAFSKCQNVKDEDIEITVDEYCEIYSINEKSKYIYEEFKKAVCNLNRRPFVKIGRKQFFWISSYEEIVDKSLKINFNPYLVGYVRDLLDNYARIELRYASKLTSEFSFRLYQWLKVDQKLRIRIKDGYSHLLMTVKEMKEMTDLDGKYTMWSMFKMHVLDSSIKDINTKTDLDVSFKAIKEGRAFTKVEFKFKTKAKLDK